MNLFSAVSAEEMQAARVVTGATMAAFIGVSLMPGMRQYARTIRWGLLGYYAVICVLFVGYVLVR